MGCCTSKSCPVNNSKQIEVIQTIETDGYYVVKADDLIPELLERPMKAHCLPTMYKGNKRYIQIYPPDDLKTTITRLNELLPIYTSMNDVPVGMTCTWLYSERGFFACQAASIIELGSTHINILIRSGHKEGDKVYSAGECLKSYSNNQFNVFSGCISRHIQNKSKVIKNAKEIFSRFTNTATYVHYEIGASKQPMTMIRNLPTIDLLRQYKGIGYNVRLFENESNCEALKGISKIDEITALKTQENKILNSKQEAAINAYIEKFRQAEMTGGKSRRYRGRKRRTTRKYKD